MCESAAYIEKEGKEELLMESLDVLENWEDGVRLIDMFGEEKQVKARVKTLSLVDHKIVLESL